MISNPLLTVSNWTCDDAAVALDWELEQGQDCRCHALVAEPEIARRLCAGQIDIDHALTAAAQADHNPLDVCRRLILAPNARISEHRERGWERSFARRKRLARQLGVDRDRALDRIAGWIERAIRARRCCTTQRPVVWARVGLALFVPRTVLDELLLDVLGPLPLRTACEITFDRRGECGIFLGIESIARVKRTVAAMSRHVVEVERTDLGPNYVAVVPHRAPLWFKPEAFYEALRLVLDQERS